METPTKKLKQGFELPVYGLGTWEMGGRFEKNLLNDDERDVIAIREAIKLGVTHIDTAEVYAVGNAEKLIAKAVEDLKREKLFITSKVWHHHLKTGQIRVALEGSLSRLNTSYLDLYLIHWPWEDISIRDSLEEMNRLKDEGLIKNIGVSNFSKEELMEAKKYSISPIVCNQVHYNLGYRWAESSGLLEYCQQNDILLTAWRPIEKGGLLDPAIPIMKHMTEKYNKTPAQICINWLISQNNVVTLAKTSSVEHLKENLGALGWQMEKEDIELLRKGFPRQITARHANDNHVISTK